MYCLAMTNLMRASARTRFESGGCAAAPFFLLFAQKKEGKEKAPC
jgi:hypothetical protein